MTKPPITASELDHAWPEAVRSATPAVKLRAGVGHTIEAWSEARGWMALQLPGGGVAFATEEDRDLVLGAIMGLNILPTQPAK